METKNRRNTRTALDVIAEFGVIDTPGVHFVCRSERLLLGRVDIERGCEQTDKNFDFGMMPECKRS